MSVWSWIRTARHVTEAEKPKVGVPTEEVPIQLSSPVWCVFLCLCAKTAIVWFLLWVVRLLTKAEPSGLGGSVGGIPGWPSLCDMGWHSCWVVGSTHVNKEML